MGVKNSWHVGCLRGPSDWAPPKCPHWDGLYGIGEFGEEFLICLRLYAHHAINLYLKFTCARKNIFSFQTSHTAHISHLPQKWKLFVGDWMGQKAETVGSKVLKLQKGVPPRSKEESFGARGWGATQVGCLAHKRMGVSEANTELHLIHVHLKKTLLNTNLHFKN